jgi:transposase-like protein
VVRDGGRLPAVPQQDPLAGRLSLPGLCIRRRLADPAGPDALQGVRAPVVPHGGHDLPRHAELAAPVVPGHVVGDAQKNGASALGLQRILGLGSYETAWTWLHKLRRAMVRPGRERLAGQVEVDETFVGGAEEGGGRRHVGKKALVAIAVEIRGTAIGRIRLQRIRDSSAASLLPFVRQAVTPGSRVVTDGLQSYRGLAAAGYVHERKVIQGSGETPNALLPRVHRVASLLKRWLLGTHQGRPDRAHLPYYLDEFTFRFNRRTARHRGAPLLSPPPAGRRRRLPNSLRAAHWRFADPWHHHIWGRLDRRGYVHGTKRGQRGRASRKYLIWLEPGAGVEPATY